MKASFFLLLALLAAALHGQGARAWRPADLGRQLLTSTTTVDCSKEPYSLVPSTVFAAGTGTCTRTGSTTFTRNGVTTTLCPGGCNCNNNWNSGFNDAACKTMLPGEGTYSACRLESFSVGQCNQLCGTAYRFMLSSDATTIEFFVGDCALGVKPSVGTFPIVQVHGGQNGGCLYSQPSYGSNIFNTPSNNNAARAGLSNLNVCVACKCYDEESKAISWPAADTAYRCPSGTNDDGSSTDFTYDVSKITVTDTCGSSRPSKITLVKPDKSETDVTSSGTLPASTFTACGKYTLKVVGKCGATFSKDILVRGVDDSTYTDPKKSNIGDKCPGSTITASDLFDNLYAHTKDGTKCKFAPSVSKTSFGSDCGSDSVKATYTVCGEDKDETVSVTLYETLTDTSSWTGTVNQCPTTPLATPPKLTLSSGCRSKTYEVTSFSKPSDTRDAETGCGAVTYTTTQCGQTFSRTEDSATFEIEGTNPADLDLCPNEPLPGTFFPAYLETKGTKCRATPSGTDSSDKDGSQCGSVQTIKRKYKICTAEKELTRKVNRDVPDFVATWTATKDKYCPTETIRPGTVSLSSDKCGDFISPSGLLPSKAADTTGRTGCGMVTYKLEFCNKPFTKDFTVGATPNPPSDPTTDVDDLCPSQPRPDPRSLFKPVPFKGPDGQPCESFSPPGSVSQLSFTSGPGVCGKTVYQRTIPYCGTVYTDTAYVEVAESEPVFCGCKYSTSCRSGVTASIVGAPSFNVGMCSFEATVKGTYCGAAEKRADVEATVPACSRSELESDLLGAAGLSK